MTNTANISNHAATQLRHGSSSFKVASDAKIRAEAIQQPSTPEELRSLGRLGRVMTSGQPLKSNVPRGYYLNIRV